MIPNATEFVAGLFTPGLLRRLNDALSKAGGVMTGALTLAANAANALEAVPKQQLDTAIGTAVLKAGSTMTGSLVLAANAVNALEPVSKQQFDAGLAANASGSDIRLLYLYRAEDAGRRSMQDGIVDPYNDATGINAGASSGYAVDSTNKLVGPTIAFSYGTNVATSGQAIHGGENPTSGTFGPAVNAFDGNSATRFSSSQSGAGVSGVAYIGQDFGGTPRNIRRITYIGRVDGVAGYAPTSVKAQYSDNGSSWSDALTQAVSDAASVTNTLDLPDVGARRYWRVLANSTLTTGNTWHMSEMTFHLGINTPNAMTVTGVAIASDVATPATARIALQLAPPVNSGAVTVNTDLIASVSRNGGTNFTAVTLTLTQALLDGTSLYEGTVSIAGQPAGSSMVAKLANANAKDTRVSGLVFQWSV